MGHLHSSSGCPCCEDMGVSFGRIESMAASRRQVTEQRVTTDGLEHIYDQQVEITVEPEPAAPQSNQELKELASIVRGQANMILEQARSLESASYRIGYLEAQLAQKDEELKLLTDGRQSTWLRSFTSWFLKGK